jgi:hypothetical protein
MFGLRELASSKLKCPSTGGIGVFIDLVRASGDQKVRTNYLNLAISSTDYRINSVHINSNARMFQNHFVFLKECTVLCFNHIKVKQQLEDE